MLALPVYAATGNITVNGYTLQYTWNWQYESNGGFQKSTAGAVYECNLSNTTLTLRANNTVYNPSSWSNFIEDSAQDTRVWVTFQNQDAQQRILRVTYECTGSVTSPNTTPLSGTIDLAYGASFPAAASEIGFNVLDNVGSTSTDTTVVSGTIKITDITVVENADLTLRSSGFGSYTYKLGDTDPITIAANASAVTQEVTPGVSLTLTASNTSTHKFYGWMTGGSLLSTSATYTTTVNAAMDIYPVFLKTDASTAGPFYVDGTRYLFWPQACMAAASGSSKTVIVVEDYTLPSTLEENGMHSSVESSAYLTSTSAGITYKLPSGLKLLVPYTTDASNPESGTFGTTPTKSNGDGLLGSIGTYIPYNIANMGASVKLTVPANTTLQIDGAMNVNSKVFLYSKWDTSMPDQLHGQVVLSDSSSKLIINGTLYCYGYITGAGTVTASNGANVYELFQVRDWRGGNVGSSWKGTIPNFLFTQYYIQNIESRYEILPGAVSNLVFSCSVSRVPVSTNANFIGGSNGFFLMDSCKVIRWFDGSTDRIHYDVQPAITSGKGTVTLNKVYIKIGALGTNVEIDSSNHILPLNGNMSINIGSGITANMLNSFRGLPGFQLKIEDGAIMNIQESGALYFYDKQSFVMGTNTFGPYTSKYQDGDSEIFDNTGTVASVVRYSPSRGKPSTRAYGSASLTVNGTLNCYENLFSTTGKVISSDGTAVTYADANGETHVYFTEDKLIKGTGQINNQARTITTALLTLQETVQNGTTVTHANVPHVPGIALLAGVSTSSTDANDSFGVGNHYGWTDNYWYQHVINTEGGSVTVTSTNGAAGSTLSPLDGRKIQNIVARVANGGSITYTIPEGYGVSIDNVVQNPVDGIYTLSNIAADTTLKLHPHDWTTATCVSKSKCTICGQETGELDTDNHSFTDYQRNDDGSYTATCDYGCDQTDTITNPTAPVSLAAIQLSAEAEVVLRMKVTTDSSFSGTIVLTEEPNEVAKNENETTYTVANGVISGVKTETVNGTTRYVLEQGIAAGEMTGDVTIEVFDSNGTRCYVYDYKAEGITPVLTRTVVDYVDLALDSSNAELIELVKRMAIYGGYAQQYFGVDTSNLAYRNLPGLDALKTETETLTVGSIADNVTWSQVSAAAMAMLLGEDLEETVETEPTEAPEVTVPDTTEPAAPTVPETTEPTESTETEPVATTEATIPTDPTETSPTESTESAATEGILVDVQEIMPNVMNSGAVAEETEPAETAVPALNFMMELTAVKTEAAAEPITEETIPAETVAVETIPEETVITPLETIPAETIAEETEPEMPILFEETLSVKLPSSILLNDGTAVSSLDSFGLEYYKQSVVLDSRIALKTSFRMSSKEDLSKYTFHLTYAKGGEAVEEPKVLTVTSENVVKDTDDSGNEFYKCVVEIDDIPVAYWDFDYIITVTKDDTSYALQTSVLAWVKECIQKSDKAAQVNMAKAMYFYNDAANKYFGK